MPGASEDSCGVGAFGPSSDHLDGHARVRWADGSESSGGDCSEPERPLEGSDGTSPPGSRTQRVAEPEDDQPRRADQEADLAVLESRHAQFLEMLAKRTAEFAGHPEACGLLQALKDECRNLERCIADHRRHLGSQETPRQGSLSSVGSSSTPCSSGAATGRRGRGHGKRQQSSRR